MLNFTRRFFWINRNYHISFLLFFSCSCGELHFSPGMTHPCISGIYFTWLCNIIISVVILCWQFLNVSLLEWLVSKVPLLISQAAFWNFKWNVVSLQCCVSFRCTGNWIGYQFSSFQSLSRVRLFATPWIAARQASLSITSSQSSLRLTSIKYMYL